VPTSINLLYKHIAQEDFSLVATFCWNFKTVMQFLLGKNLIQARTIFFPFFPICPSFFVKPGTKAPVSRLHFILLHRNQKYEHFYRDSIHRSYYLFLNPGQREEKREKMEG